MRVACALIIAAAVCGAVARESLIDTDVAFRAWELWKVENSRAYQTKGEHDRRFSVFEENAQFIADWNARDDKPFSMRLNRFADLTHDEFRAKYLGSVLTATEASPDQLFVNASSRGRASEKRVVDWRSKGAVTSVKDQGKCGSCWTFSTVGACEGATAVAGHPLVSLSTQQLADCSHESGSNGCNGGDMRGAMEHVVKHGLMPEKSYPYRAKESASCLYRKSAVAARFRTVVPVDASEDALAQAVEKYGPVSVAIDAGQPGFQFYDGGVYADKKCSASALNHGVVVVGFSEGEDQDYWIVKNSWGPEWGEEGYIKIARNKGNTCGIATYATAIVAA